MFSCVSFLSLSCPFSLRTYINTALIIKVSIPWLSGFSLKKTTRYVHAHTYTHTYAHTHTRIHIYTNTYARTHSHIQTHTYTHTHTHTRKPYSQDFCSRTTRYSVRVCVDMSRTRTQVCAPTDVFTLTYNVHLKTLHTLQKI